jgi:hypothetical protein
MTLLASLCDEFVALELGAAICKGSPEEVLADLRVTSSYLGTDEVAIERSGTSGAARERAGQRPALRRSRRGHPLSAGYA